MDQLKQSLAVAVKYGFWISTAVILLGAVGIWWVVTGRLVTENEERTRKIEGQVQAVSTLRNQLPTHPNPITHEVMNGLIENRQAEVLQAWQTLYDTQRDILVWPVKELREDFVREFRDLIPIESSVEFPTPPDQEKETSLLNRYRYYIGNVLPDIAEIAGAEWTASLNPDDDPAMRERNSRPSRADEVMSSVDITGAEAGPLVKWSEGSQASLIEDLFPWYPDQPSTLEIYYSQENLWILRQMMKIIADVNGQAQQPFEAKIHRINRLSMGKNVGFREGVIEEPVVAASDGIPEDFQIDGPEDLDLGMDGPMMGPNGSMMGPNGELMQEQIDPADNRYLNTNDQPITGSELRAAFASDSPEDAPLKVAKRVPVMMSLQMDQRAVPELLAACGSAPLMVEVKQVRIFPKGQVPAAGRRGNPGRFNSRGGARNGPPASVMEYANRRSGNDTSGAQQGVDRFPLDVSVVVYGLIHIYNPPQKEKLGVEQVTAETVVDGESMGGQTEPAVPSTTSSRVVDPAGATAPNPAGNPTSPATDDSTATAPAAAESPAVGDSPPAGTIP